MTDCTLFPDASPESKGALGKMSRAYYAQADQMVEDACQLESLALTEQPGAAERITRLAKQLRRWAQMSLRQAGYDARTIYDRRY